MKLAFVKNLFLDMFILKKEILKPCFLINLLNNHEIIKNNLNEYYGQ